MAEENKVKETPKPRQIIYIAQTARKVGFQKSLIGSTLLPDGTTQRTMLKAPIIVDFNGHDGNTFTLTDESVKQFGLSFEELQKIIEDHSQFKSGEIRKISAEEAKLAIENMKKSGAATRSTPKVVAGVMTTGSLKQ